MPASGSPLNIFNYEAVNQRYLDFESELLTVRYMWSMSQKNTDFYEICMLYQCIMGNKILNIFTILKRY